VRIGKELPVHRRISDFVVVYQPLPRTTSRKLKKPELLKIYHSIKRKTVFEDRPALEEQLSVMEMALMETDEYHGVIESIGRIAPGVDKRVINPRTHFEIDLGLDSLHRIELLSSIERTFNITIPEDVFDKMETITDLVSLVKEQQIENRPTSIDRVLHLKERILTVPHVLPARKPHALGFLGRITASVANAVNPRAGFAEPLSAEAGPYILVSFHQSASDAFRILQALPRHIAENTFSLSEDIKYPWLPYVCYSSNMIEIKKANDPIETIKVSLSVIRDNKNLISFPEGSILPPGKPAEFKPGIGLIARETGAAIVPVRTTGKTLRFGRPFRISSLIERGLLAHAASPQEITEYIRTKVTGLY
jgi:long-chain acyl-CoA synthetase